MEERQQKEMIALQRLIQTTDTPVSGLTTSRALPGQGSAMPSHGYLCQHPAVSASATSSLFSPGVNNAPPLQSLAGCVLLEQESVYPGALPLNLAPLTANLATSTVSSISPLASSTGSTGSLVNMASSSAVSSTSVVSGPSSTSPRPPASGGSPSRQFPLKSGASSPKQHQRAEQQLAHDEMLMRLIHNFGNQDKSSGPAAANHPYHQQSLPITLNQIKEEQEKNKRMFAVGSTGPPPPVSINNSTPAPLTPLIPVSGGNSPSSIRRSSSLTNAVSYAAQHQQVPGGNNANSRPTSAAHPGSRCSAVSGQSVSGTSMANPSASSLCASQVAPIGQPVYSTSLTHSASASKLRILAGPSCQEPVNGGTSQSSMPSSPVHASSSNCNSSHQHRAQSTQSSPTRPL